MYEKYSPVCKQFAPGDEEWKGISCRMIEENYAGYNFTRK